MAWDATPWFVGGGAVHSPEVARLVAHAALGDAEGIIGPPDLKVVPLAVPGTSVRVMPGAAAITSKAASGRQQMYAARNPTEDVVAIAPTGSGGGRSDLIVARIEDPFMAGEPWQAPADPTTAQYVYTRVISNVSASTKTMPAGQTGIVLARIDIPANTGTITAAMIKDLRKVARPRRERATDTIFPAVTKTITSNVHSKIASSRSIDVPTWATRAIVRGDLSGLRVQTGNAYGEIHLGLGATQGQNTLYDENWSTEGWSSRSTYLAALDIAIPSSIRGTAVPVDFYARRVTGPGYLQLDVGSTLFVDVEFLEVAE